jgi:hypothetical protein
MKNAALALAVALVVLAHTALSGGLATDDPAYAARAFGRAALTVALPGVLGGLLLWYMAPVLKRHARVPDWRWFALATTLVLALVLQAVG